MNEFENLCKGCMAEIGQEEICPKCGYRQNEEQLAPYLAKETMLEKRYMVGRKIERDGEGVSYIAYDSVTKTPVLIREFLPLSICDRGEGNTEVEPLEGQKETFEAYKDHFLQYFRAIARFREFSTIQSIYNIFIENNTAYVVLEWEQTITLEEFVEKSGGRVDWNVVRPLFMPLLSLLSKMHSVGVGHYGICPSNLVITRSGKMKLSGFTTPELRKSGTYITAELYPGCSAVEQYIGGYDLNESTDIYGFTASLFFTLTGVYPKEAPLRREDERLFIATGLLKMIPNHVVSALANGLQVLPERRTVDFERLRAELSASPTVVNKIDSRQEERLESGNQKKKGMSNFAWGALSCGIALVILLAVGTLWFWGSNFYIGSNTSSSSDVSSFASIVSSEEAESNVKNAVIVPDLKGQKFKETQQTASEFNEYQVLMLSEEFNDSIPEGCIISQTPEAKSKIEKGSAIIVTVSKGQKVRELPNISGLPLSEASAKVTEAGLQPTQGQEYSDTVAEGIVIGYEGHSPRDKLEYGSSVKIIVSRGKGTEVSS